MIADFSSFLELLAAGYISMLLDVETLNRLWYPEDYYKKIQDTLKSVFPEEEGQLNAKIVEDSKNTIEVRNRRMRRRAVFLLALTAILLFLIGVESTFSNDVLSYEGFYNAIAITFFIGIIICFIWRRLFDKWNTTFLLLFVEAVALALLMIFPIKLSFYKCIARLYPFFIISLVTLPVLWEVFVRWLFSSVYSGYLRSNVQKVKQEYNEAMLALESNNKKQMPRVYRKMIDTSIYESQGRKTPSDICIQGYMDIRNRKLNTICLYPNGFLIFFSWFGYTFSNLFKKIQGRKIKTKKEKGTVVGLYTTDSHLREQDVILNFQKEYDEFLVEKARMNGKISIKQFCQKHQYDANAMITWLKQRGKKKNTNS